MKSLSGIGLGLSVVFGCLLLALCAELYYLLWWKKRLTSRAAIERGSYNHSSPRKELLHIFCCQKPSFLIQTALNPQQLSSSGLITDTHTESQHQQLELHSNKDILGKPCEEESMETELMGLHKLGLGGPPRFLFTIVEETKEDLVESEDGRSKKGSRGRSLSDLLFTVETPFLTPLASPSLFTPPVTPVLSSTSCASRHNSHGFNPLFESSTDAEFSRIRSSPPPKFKFLQDAEDKMMRRKMREEAGTSVVGNGHVHHSNSQLRGANSKLGSDEEDGSFITILVDKNHHGSRS